MNSDHDWRIEKFGDAAVASAKAVEAVTSPVSATKLIQHARKHGPDGVLESAILLERDAYGRVEAVVKRFSWNRLKGRWEYR